MAVRMVYNYVRFHIRKVFRNYNVLERTDKLLEKEKLEVAPRHPGTEKKFTTVVKTMPEIKEKLDKKSEELIERMKSINIESTDDTGEIISRGQKPTMRIICELPEFGYEDPKVIPEGKCSLKQALAFINKNQSDPKEWTNEKISETYSMKIGDVKNINEHFRVFEMYLSYKSQKKSPLEITLTTLGVGSVKKGKKMKKYDHLEAPKEETKEKQTFTENSK